MQARTLSDSHYRSALCQRIRPVFIGRACTGCGARLELDGVGASAIDIAALFSDAPNPRNSSSSAANLMPHVTMPDTTWTATNTALTVTGITVTDPDAGSNSLAITVASYGET